MATVQVRFTDAFKALDIEDQVTTAIDKLNLHKPSHLKWMQEFIFENTAVWLDGDFLKTVKASLRDTEDDFATMVKRTLVNVILESATLVRTIEPEDLRENNFVDKFDGKYDALFV